jgi:hypothetical protein
MQQGLAWVMLDFGLSSAGCRLSFEVVLLIHTFCQHCFCLLAICLLAV